MSIELWLSANKQSLVIKQREGDDEEREQEREYKKYLKQ